MVIAAPLTTKVKHYKGNPVLKPTKTNGLMKESEILVFHLRSISKEKLIHKLGNIENDQLAMVIKTLQDIIKY